MPVSTRRSMIVSPSSVLLASPSSREEEKKESFDQRNLPEATLSSEQRRSSPRFQSPLKNGDVADNEQKPAVATKSSSKTTRKRKPPSSDASSPIPEVANSATPSPPPVETDAPPKKKKPRAKRSPSPKKTVSITPPPDWEATYALVEELRKDRTAPCDGMGCEALPDPKADAKGFRFQVLMSLVLSSQTKDAVVHDAIRGMQKAGILSVDALIKLQPSQIQPYIAKVGFHNNKAKYIHQIVNILQERYNGDIPKTAAEMIEHLPGVGPKMAYICESVAWKTQSGIGVDTHMHRLFNMLHWVKNTTTPEQTRVQLESWLPQSKWGTVNLLWVGFGQEVQQDKPKILRKALYCSRPGAALKLLKRCGLDYMREGKKLGLDQDIQNALADARVKTEQEPLGGDAKDTAMI